MPPKKIISPKVLCVVELSLVDMLSAKQYFQFIFLLLQKARSTMKERQTGGGQNMNLVDKVDMESADEFWR